MPRWLLFGAALFGPLAFGCVEPWSVALLECALWSALLLSLRERRPLGPPALQRALLLGILAVALLGLLQALNPVAPDGPRSWLPSTASGSATWRAVLLWSAYAALALAASWAFETLADLRRLAWSLLASGFLVAIIGLVQQSQGNQLIYGWRQVGVYHQPFGPYYNRNHAATLLAAAALAGLGILFSRAAGRRRSASIGHTADFFATQLLIFLPVAVVAYALVRTGCRAALHSAALWALLGLFLASAAGRLKFSLFRAAFAAMILLGYLAWVGNNPRYLAPLSLPLEHPDNGSWAVRVSMYRSALRMIGDSPLTGFGLGALEAAFPAYQHALVRLRVDHLHSDWLELLVETGAAGFLAVAAALCLWLGRALKNLEAADPELRQLGVWFVCAAGAILLHNAVEFGLQIPANAVVFLLILCGLGALTPEEGLPPSRLSGGAAAAMGLAGVFALALAARALIGSWYDHKASRASLPARPGLLARAIKWDRRPSYLHRLSLAQFDQARADLGSRRPRLEEAFHSAEAAWRAEPLNRAYRSNYEALAWQLSQTGGR